MQWEVFADDLLLVQVFVFALQALSSPALLSFPRAGTSSEVTLSGASPSPSLPSEGRDEGGGGGGGARDALVLLPEGLPLLPLDIFPAGGVEEPLVSRSVHASSLLPPRFIRGLGVQELLSCGGLLLPAQSRLALPPHLCTPCEVMGREGLQRLSLFSVASPSSSLHALRGDEAGESSEARSRYGSSQASRSSAWETRKEL